MERLYRGIHSFRQSYFKDNEGFFKRISTNQTPNVLFITCSDSRVDPALVTQSKPGELFIIRNVGNIVPPYDAIRDKNCVAAAIELAVLSLKISDIIVCGHSNCGAMRLLYQKDLDNMPHLKHWIRLASPVKEHIDKFYGNTPESLRNRIMEKENILCQLKNIETYPFILSALEAGKIHLHGWYYDIGSGEILTYNPINDKFEDILISLDRAL